VRSRRAQSRANRSDGNPGENDAVDLLAMKRRSATKDRTKRPRSIPLRSGIEHSEHNGPTGGFRWGKSLAAQARQWMSNVYRLPERDVASRVSHGIWLPAEASQNTGRSVAMFASTICVPNRCGRINGIFLHANSYKNCPALPVSEPL
jgi:hypothetical protein